MTTTSRVKKLRKLRAEVILADFQKRADAPAWKTAHGARLHWEDAWRVWAFKFYNDLHRDIKPRLLAIVAEAQHLQQRDVETHGWDKKRQAKSQTIEKATGDGGQSSNSNEQQDITNFFAGPGDEMVAAMLGKGERDDAGAANMTRSVDWSTIRDRMNIGNPMGLADGSVQSYIGMALNTSQEAGQYSLRALGLGQTFSWANRRNMGRSLYSVRGSKVIAGMYDNHMAALTDIIMNATYPIPDPVTGQPQPQPPSSVADQLMQQFPGLGGKDAERVARTETAAVWENQQMNTMIANDVPGGSVLNASGPSIDSSAIDELCVEIAGNSPYSPPEETPEPPFHPNCRCTLIPSLTYENGDSWLPPREPWTGQDPRVMGPRSTLNPGAGIRPVRPPGWPAKQEMPPIVPRHPAMKRPPTERPPEPAPSMVVPGDMRPNEMGGSGAIIDMNPTVWQIYESPKGAELGFTVDKEYAKEMHDLMLAEGDHPISIKGGPQTVLQWKAHTTPEGVVDGVTRETWLYGLQPDGMVTVEMVGSAQAKLDMLGSYAEVAADNGGTVRLVLDALKPGEERTDTWLGAISKASRPSPQGLGEKYWVWGQKPRLEKLANELAGREIDPVGGALVAESSKLGKVSVATNIPSEEAYYNAYYGKDAETERQLDERLGHVPGGGSRASSFKLYKAQMTTKWGKKIRITVEAATPEKAAEVFAKSVEFMDGLPIFPKDLKAVSFLQKKNLGDRADFEAAAHAGGGRVTFFNGDRYPPGQGTWDHEMGHIYGKYATPLTDAQFNDLFAKYPELKSLPKDLKRAYYSSGGPRAQKQWMESIGKDMRYQADPKNGLVNQFGAKRFGTPQSPARDYNLHYYQLNGPVTEYGGTNIAEDWADSIEGFIYDRRFERFGTIDGRAARFADVYPNRAKVLEKMFGPAPRKELGTHAVGDTVQVYTSAAKDLGLPYDEATGKGWVHGQVVELRPEAREGAYRPDGTPDPNGRLIPFEVKLPDGTTRAFGHDDIRKPQGPAPKIEPKKIEGTPYTEGQAIEFHGFYAGKETWFPATITDARYGKIRIEYTQPRGEKGTSTLMTRELDGKVRLPGAGEIKPEVPEAGGPTFSYAKDGKLQATLRPGHYGEDLKTAIRRSIQEQKKLLVDAVKGTPEREFLDSLGTHRYSTGKYVEYTPATTGKAALLKIPDEGPPVKEPPAPVKPLRTTGSSVGEITKTTSNEIELAASRGAGSQFKYHATTPREHLSAVVTINGNQVRMMGEFGNEQLAKKMMADAAKQLESSPPAALAKLDTIMFAANKNPADEYWAKQYGGGYFKSTATGANGQITFWNSGVAREGTLDHELGHVLGKITNDWSNSREWATFDGVLPKGWSRQAAGSVPGELKGATEWGHAAVKDRIAQQKLQKSGRITGNGKTDGGLGVTAYGENSLAEDWADSIKLYTEDQRYGRLGRLLSLDGRRYERDLRFADIYPNRAKIIERYWDGERSASKIDIPAPSRYDTTVSEPAPSPAPEAAPSPAPDLGLPDQVMTPAEVDRAEARDWERLSAEEKDVLQGYVNSEGGLTGDTNWMIRHGEKLDTEQKVALHWADKAMEKLPGMPRDAVGYRVVNGMEFKVGSTFKDDGFTSLTMTEHGLRMMDELVGPWEGTGTGEKTLLEIRVPQGTKGAFITSSGVETGGLVPHEFLTARGTEFQIVGERTLEDGTHVVEMEVGAAKAEVPVGRTLDEAVAGATDEPLPRDWSRPYGGPATIKVAAPGEVTIYRVGELKDPYGRGTFFGVDAKSIEDYRSIHANEEIKAYDVTPKKTAVFRNQADAWKQITDRPWNGNAGVAQLRSAEKTIASKLRAQGFDSYILTAPPLPARMEFAWIDKKGLKNIVERKTDVPAERPPVAEVTPRVEPAAEVKAGSTGTELLADYLPHGGYGAEAPQLVQQELTKAERNAIITNTSTPTLEYEGVWRGEGARAAVRANEPLSPAQEKFVQALHDAVAKSTLAEDVSVYRGVRGGEDALIKMLEGEPGDLNSVVGKTFTDRFMPSTTTQEHSAYQFTALDSSTRVRTVIKIDVPAGTEAAWVPAVDDTYAIQKELLLQQNMQYEVVGVSRGTLASGEEYIRADVRVVPEKPPVLEPKAPAQLPAVEPKVPERGPEVATGGPDYSYAKDGKLQVSLTGAAEADRRSQLADAIRRSQAEKKKLLVLEPKGGPDRAWIEDLGHRYATKDYVEFTPKTTGQAALDQLEAKVEVPPEGRFSPGEVRPEGAPADWEMPGKYVHEQGAVDGPKITPGSAEYTAASAYSQGSYVNMNDRLRGGLGADERSATFLRAFGRTTEDMTLQRGMDMKTWRALASGKADVGAVLRDDGFASTATLEGNFGREVRVYIDTPKGTKAFSFMGQSGMTHEHEIVLAPGTEFRVKSVVENPNAIEKLTVRVEVVGQKTEEAMAGYEIKAPEPVILEGKTRQDLRDLRDLRDEGKITDDQYNAASDALDLAVETAPAGSALETGAITNVKNVSNVRHANQVWKAKISGKEVILKDTSAFHGEAADANELNAAALGRELGLPGTTVPETVMRDITEQGLFQPGGIDEAALGQARIRWASEHPGATFEELDAYVASIRAKGTPVEGDLMVQEYVPKTRLGGGLGKDAGEFVSYEEAHGMAAFDIVIANGDRNAGNWLVKKDAPLGGKVVPIDHGISGKPWEQDIADRQGYIRGSSAFKFTDFKLTPMEREAFQRVVNDAKFWADRRAAFEATIHEDISISGDLAGKLYSGKVRVPGTEPADWAGVTEMTPRQYGAMMMDGQRKRMQYLLDGGEVRLTGDGSVKVSGDWLHKVYEPTMAKRMELAFRRGFSTTVVGS